MLMTFKTLKSFQTIKVLMTWAVCTWHDTHNLYSVQVLKMSSKEVRHEVEGEVKEFFARSSIHGLAYFFSEFSLVERLFWVIVTIAMLASGSVWVNTALNDWAQNPTVLNTEISSTLEAIQVCPLKLILIKKTHTFLLVSHHHYLPKLCTR